MEDDVICLNTKGLNMDGVQMPNPFVECETLADATKAAGFELTAPKSVNSSDRREFRAIEGELLEVIYREGENETARIRKAPGAEEVLQDTLLKFLQTAPTFESTQHEKAWLLRVAGNLSKNRLDYDQVRRADELSEELAVDDQKDSKKFQYNKKISSLFRRACDTISENRYQYF